MEDILAIVFLFGGGTLILLAFSPVGRALADRIRGRSAGADDVAAQLAEHRDEVLTELGALRTEVGQLAERVDFAERLLARQRDPQRLGGG